MRPAFLSLAALALFATASRAADWLPITTELLAKEKTGFGGLCGGVVDHATGQIIVNLSDRGTLGNSDKGDWRTIDKATVHVDWCAADWTDPDMIVLTGAGIIESTDSGATWSSPIAAPKELKVIGGLTWLEYDPIADVLYIMKMGTELFAMQRK